ncbi:hypothetical protein V6N11_033386 [Hibiscus sabdariffa]|uniref:Uncharacterized protein n=1 Tax=Hibiscus sabdariffa TaxID=183260 RepID=A0ABR2PYJ8_9ROSI
MSGDSLWAEFRELLVLLERYVGQLPRRDFRASMSTAVVEPQHEACMDEFQVHVMFQIIEQNGGLKENKSKVNGDPGRREGLLHKTNVVNDELVEALEFNEGNVVAIKNGGVVVMEKDSRVLMVGEPIEVGASLCVIEQSNGESLASFMAPFVAQLSGTKPATNSTAVRFSLHDIFQKIGLSSDNSKETSLHAQGEDVPFTGVMVTTDSIKGNSMDTFKPHMQPKEVIDLTLQSVSFIESVRTQFMHNLNLNYVGKNCREDLVSNQWGRTLYMNHGVPRHVTSKYSTVSMNQVFDKDLNVRLGDWNMKLSGLPLFLCTEFMLDQDRNITLVLKSELLQCMVFNSIPDVGSYELVGKIFDPERHCNSD